MAGHIVTGPVAVLPTKDGSERYMYRGALIGDGFTAEGIKHALSVGLIAPVEDAPADGEDEPYKGVTVADLKADIEKRNVGRSEADLIVAAEPGNRPELVAALVADDAKSAK